MINDGWAKRDYVIGYESPVDGRTVYMARYDPLTLEWKESDTSFTCAFGSVYKSNAITLATMLKLPFPDVELKVFERVIECITVFEVEDE